MAENNVDIDEMGMGADMEALRANLAKLRKAGVKVSEMQRFIAFMSCIVD